jgi:uncharacterized protein
VAQTGYPQPTDLYINDFAHLLSSTDAGNITKLLADLKNQHGIEATVVTISSIHDYPTGAESIEAFATHLFNTWGIGDKANNKGVLILVAAQDRKMRIELGTGYESRYNDDMQQVIDEHMLPAFKQGNFRRGLYQGTRAVVATLTGNWPPDESPAPTPAPASSSGNNVSAPSPVASSSGRGWNWNACFLWILIAAIAYQILTRIFGWPVGNSSRSSDDSDRHSWSSSHSSSSLSGSSSSSSFGGGSSSGGGASGGW